VFDSHPPINSLGGTHGQPNGRSEVRKYIYYIDEVMVQEYR
jgi:hypothetical protein